MSDKNELEKSLISAKDFPQSKALVVSSDKSLAPIDPLQSYLRQISQYKLLDPEEEKRLTLELYETGDIEVAKKLVLANLRLVVKIAMEYRHSYRNILDLIQEGNLGLMKAVSKFDPHQGAKLSYYASWWIKSYILKFILDNFRLVKIGTTQEQKRLFYNLMREKDRLASLGSEVSMEVLAQNLGVDADVVQEMDLRLSGQSETSLDLPVNDSGSATIADLIPNEGESIEEALGHAQGLEILKNHLGDFIKTLKPRDQEIFQKRLMAEVPSSLQSIADEYGVSRERIRQIEERLMGGLKVYMRQFIR